MLGRHLADQIGECLASCGIPPATPGINQHSPLSRLTPQHTHTKTNTQQRGGVAESVLEKEKEARSHSPHELSVNKEWKGRRANSGCVISCCLK
jgi:hypothetical protein